MKIHTLYLWTTRSRYESATLQKIYELKIHPVHSNYKRQAVTASSAVNPSNSIGEASRQCQPEPRPGSRYRLGQWFPPPCHRSTERIYRAHLNFFQGNAYEGNTIATLRSFSISQKRLHGSPIEISTCRYIQIWYIEECHEYKHVQVRIPGTRI